MADHLPVQHPPRIFGPASAAIDVLGQAQWQDVPFRQGKSSTVKETPNASTLKDSLMPTISNSSSRRDAMNLNMLNTTRGNVAVPRWVKRVTNRVIIRLVVQEHESLSRDGGH